MIFNSVSTILIWSGDYQRLATWYKETFSLKEIERISHPKDTGILYEFPGGKPWIWIGKHSEIRGKNVDPLRIMINVNVDSITDAYNYLKAKQVTFMAEPFKAPTFDKWFITFSDPDGNTLQCIGPK